MGTVVSGRRQAFPARGAAQTPGSGSPAKQCSRTEPLHEAALPTWCRQATALRATGKTLSDRPDFPSCFLTMPSDQHCHPVLPVSLGPNTDTSPANVTRNLIRACPGPYARVRHYSTCQGISYPGKRWTAPETFVLVHLWLCNSPVWTQRFLPGVRLLTGPVSSLHLASPRFLHFRFSYELNI